MGCRRGAGAAYSTIRFDSEQEGVSMAVEVKEVTIAGNPLVCPVCGAARFWERKTQLNTRAATFFNFDWANRNPTNYVCETCGYMFWFHN